MARDIYTAVHEDWQDQPSEETPIMAADLEHIESGIKTAMDNRALREVYGDRCIRLSISNQSETSPSTISIEMGVNAQATGDFSAAIGNNAKTTGNCSAAIGSYVEALHMGALVIGISNKSSRHEQFVTGRYNADDAKALFIIGYGAGESGRENVHTVDYNGNAYFKGDVANGKYSLNGLGELGVISEDVTEECIVTANGQTVEVTVPLNIIMHAYGYYILAGEFIGVIYFGGIPPMLLNMQISAVKDGEVHGKAVLTNLVSSTTATYGYKFEGDIQLLFTYSSDTPKAKAVFNLGRDAAIQYATVFRTKGSAIDFTISELRDKELTYDEAMEILNGEGET